MAESRRNETTNFGKTNAKKIQMSSLGTALTLSRGRDMGKSERVEEQESLQTTGGQQATDVRLHY